MGKVAILTMLTVNLGNRLQNFALQTTLEKLGFEAETILREKPGSKPFLRRVRLFLRKKPGIKSFLKQGSAFVTGKEKYSRFSQFNKRINWSGCVVSKETVTERLSEKYDKFIVGSDQIWNPCFSISSEFDYLPMIGAEKKFAYAASFGISDIPKEFRPLVQKGLSSFTAISVREDSGAEIVKEMSGKCAEVVLDPVFLLSRDEWRDIEVDPRIIQDNERYILKYFLGDDTSGDILKDTELKGYKSIDATAEDLPIGPAEFVYLVDHAALILTDSYHASVFSFIFGKPFVMFHRAGLNMLSRLDTFCEKFNLQRHRYGVPDFSLDAVFNEDYKNSYVILAEEKSRSISFLKEHLI